jgi:hypothetical protein
MQYLELTILEILLGFHDQNFTQVTISCKPEENEFILTLGDIPGPATHESISLMEPTKILEFLRNHCPHFLEGNHLWVYYCPDNAEISFDIPDKDDSVRDYFKGNSKHYLTGNPNYPTITATFMKD